MLLVAQVPSASRSLTPSRSTGLRPRPARCRRSSSPPRRTRTPSSRRSTAAAPPPRRTPQSSCSRLAAGTRARRSHRRGAGRGCSHRRARCAISPHPLLPRAPPTVSGVCTLVSGGARRSGGVPADGAGAAGGEARLGRVGGVAGARQEPERWAAAARSGAAPQTPREGNGRDGGGHRRGRTPARGRRDRCAHV